MSFLTLIIVLGLVQLWGSGGPLQRDGWLEQWITAVKGAVASAWFRIVLLIVLPIVLLVVLLALVHGALFGLVSLLIYIAVLLYSLGRGDFNNSIRQYLQAWGSGNFESAYEKAVGIGNFAPSESINDAESLHRQVRTAMIYGGYERWFAVVFWFLLLGPVGALVYRLTYLLIQSDQLPDERQRLLELLRYLDWIPSRLLAFSFALTGNFVACSQRCWELLLESLSAAELLDHCAMAAVEGNREVRVYDTEGDQFVRQAEEEITALQSLLSRSVVCWLLVIALATLFAV